MSNIKLLFYASSLEVASAFILISESNAASEYLVFLTLHGISAAILTIFAMRVLPKKFRSPVLFTSLLVFGFVFFIPYFGFILALGSIFVGLFLPSLFKANAFEHIDAPQYTPMPSAALQGIKNNDLKSLLTDNSLPDEQRIQGMLVVKSLPVRVTGNILRDSLGDSFEDLRLLAYGVLDQKEKDVTQRIDRAKTALQECADKQKPQLLRLLAELYWELVYQDLARGDIRQMAMDNALSYIDEVLASNPIDTEMWYLQGRIYLEKKYMDKAEICLLKSKELGMATTRINPWLAEACLHLGKPLDTQALMAELHDTNPSAASMAAIHYWSKLETS